MTTKEKLELIENKLNLINNAILKHKKWNIVFKNKGTNNYCLTIVLGKKEITCKKFDTYGSVISCLELLEEMFNRALEERGKNGK